MASRRVAQILSAVASGGGPIDGYPGRLVAACTATLPITGAGVVLMTETGPAATVATTDGAAAVMAELQFTLGEGPCIDASASGRPVLQPDLAATGLTRWPAFCAGALDAGIAAVFALPLRVGGIRLGVLELYRATAGPLSGLALAEALAHADAATAILLHLQAHASASGTGTGLIPVIEDRAEVHQATGIVAVQASVTLTQALVLLRARAFASERPISSLARDVVRGTVLFTNDGGDLDG